MEPMEQPDIGPEWRPLSQDLIEEEGWFHGRWITITPLSKAQPLSSITVSYSLVKYFSCQVFKVESKEGLQ
jgi:hypothetical protein